MQVVKRDGTIVEFDLTKIRVALEKTNATTQEMSDEDIDRIITIVDRKIPKSGGLGVEDIQDLVEDTLLKSKFNRTAKSYILYRDMRSRNRDNKSKLLKDIAKKINGTNIVNQNANVDEGSFGGRKGEASNELMKWFALNNCMSKKSKDNHENNEIYIHDLDSYSLGMHNCLSVPLDHLLSGGFTTRQTDIRPASSISTAFQLIAVIFQVQSLQQFGGVSATHLDWTMVPYVRKSLMKHYLFEYLKNTEEFYALNLDELSDSEIDDWIQEHKAEYLSRLNLTAEDFFMGSTLLDEKLYKKALFEVRRETKQAVEGMYHNLNSLQSRSGNQLPFSSINYGTCTSPEGRMVIRALLEGSIKGVGKHHRTSIFPCGIFQFKREINGLPGTPNYDLFQLALKSTSKRLYPNYANCDWCNDVSKPFLDRLNKEEVIKQLSEEDRNKLIEQLKLHPELQKFLLLNENLEISWEVLPIELFSTMGCRTANGYDVYGIDSFKKNIQSVISTGKLYDNYVSSAQKDGRGNICPVTIILPTLAMEAGRDVDCFMALLETKIKEAKDMLIERFNYICQQDASSAKFMYENNTMSGYVAEEGIRSALRHGTLAIGQLGLAETLELLVGCNHVDPKGMELAKKIELLFEKKCAEFKEKYKLNFGVYYTPAESLCYTAMKKFKEKYGEISKVSDREYFTNSIHIPVWQPIDPFEKIRLESELTKFSSAGCITYVELDGAVQSNLDALESLVLYAMDYGIPYFAVNLPIDDCLACGYSGQFNDRCPECGSENIMQLRRVTGYLSTTYKHFNKGKQAEVRDRVKHIRYELPTD